MLDPQLLIIAGAAAYGLPVMVLSIALAGDGRVAAMRRHQRIGPLLGLALGLWFLGLMWDHWLGVGSFSWGGEGRWPDAAWVAFMGLWISYIHLEVWGFEPLRQAQGDAAAFGEALAGVRNQVWLHVTLLIATVGFALLG